MTVTTVTAPTGAAGPGNRSAAAETVGRSAAAQTVAPDVGPVTESTGSTSPPTIATTTTLPMKRVVEIVGHGFGHGRGLGQWGAFGYATDYGWTAKQILSHFYPGTGAGKVAPTSAIGVRLLAQEGKTLTVYQPKGRLFVGADGALLQLAGGTPPAAPVAVTTAAPVPTSGQSAATALPVPAGFTDANPSSSSVALAAAAEPAVPAEPVPNGPAAIRITLTAKGTFTLADSPDCDGPFVVRAARVTATAVVVSTAADRNPTPSNDPSELLSLCGRGGRAIYRGDLLAIDGAASGQPGQHTVNQVGLESYLRSVVPSEVPKGWGGVKGGMEALKAQAVAARSYAAAERRTGYSNTCDTTSCQVYKGRGEYRGSGFVSFEDARTDQAVADTAGEVRVEPKTGTPIRTEFSSSTGGHSAPGEIATPVLDEGDSTANNPYKSWTVVLDASRFEGKLGPLTAVETTKRDGFGPDGGRAQEVTFRFVNGTSTNTGAELASRFGLRSTLFSAQLKLVPLTTSESKQADPSDTSADDSASGEPTTSLPKTKVIKPSKDPAPRKGTTTIEVKRPTTNS